MPLAEVQTHPIERLHEFSSRVFMHFGVPRDDAQIAADVLAAADLRGVDSHGVARLRTYFDMLALGRINPKANIRVIRELPGGNFHTFQLPVLKAQPGKGGLRGTPRQPLHPDELGHHTLSATCGDLLAVCVLSVRLR